MKAPNTRYRIQVMLQGEPPSEVQAVLSYLLDRSKLRKMPSPAIPNHPFFMIGGWSSIFQQGFGRAKINSRGQFKFTVTGETSLEEQDIALFLRWLTPYIEPTRRPKRIAVIRNNARRDLTCLSYFVYNEVLSMCFVNAPFMQITNFQAAA